MNWVYALLNIMDHLLHAVLMVLKVTTECLRATACGAILHLSTPRQPEAKYFKKDSNFISLQGLIIWIWIECVHKASRE